MSERLEITPNLICHCEHNLLSHKHLWEEDKHCGYPGCKCDSFVGKPTPPEIVNAIALLGAWVKEKNYKSVRIGPEGGAYFEIKVLD